MDKLLESIIEGIDDKKGNDIVAIDLRAIDGAICSWFVVCNADSTTQVGAIASGVEEKVKEQLGEKVWRVEGLTNSLWVVMDYGNILVHIFQTEMRQFYKLEQLWADAPIQKFETKE